MNAREAAESKRSLGRVDAGLRIALVALWILGLLGYLTIVPPPTAFIGAVLSIAMAITLFTRLPWYLQSIVALGVVVLDTASFPMTFAWVAGAAHITFASISLRRQQQQ